MTMAFATRNVVDTVPFELEDLGIGFTRV
jgi:hypothetical protein